MMQTLTGWRLIWQHLLFLAHKELLALVKDPRMKFMLIMPPIIQGLIFGYAANCNRDRVPSALVDSAHSAASRALRAHLHPQIRRKPRRRRTLRQNERPCTQPPRRLADLAHQIVHEPTSYVRDRRS